MKAGRLCAQVSYPKPIIGNLGRITEVIGLEEDAFDGVKRSVKEPATCTKPASTELNPLVTMPQLMELIVIHPVNSNCCLNFAFVPVTWKNKDAT